MNPQNRRRKTLDDDTPPGWDSIPVHRPPAPTPRTTPTEFVAGIVIAIIIAVAIIWFAYDTHRSIKAGNDASERARELMLQNPLP